jgi:hypothetical protein
MNFQTSERIIRDSHSSSGYMKVLHVAVEKLWGDTKGDDTWDAFPWIQASQQRPNPSHHETEPQHSKGKSQNRSGRQCKEQEPRYRWECTSDCQLVGQTLEDLTRQPMYVQRNAKARSRIFVAAEKQ